MEVKKALENYFNDLILMWKSEYNTYPQVPLDEDINPLLYVSEPDEEEYVCWKPIEKYDLEDLEEIEKRLDMNIHHTLKEYFNSYWFLNLQGFYEAKLINLEPVEPGKSIFEFFKVMKQYEESNGRELRYIQIGFVSPEDMAVMFDNETGQITIEDFERQEQEVLADTLVELLSNLKVVI
ncbi:SecY-interacting protein Syd [Sutcliffiella horikoshii]|uniref:SecY-interacting protein Syd n=1 Tax=Sutcliffiella horikoshii TaxID=79883 RepID=UPI00384C26DF